MKKLSLLTIVLMTVVSVDSVRNLPAAAQSGQYLIVCFVFAALFFLIPSALAAAELSVQNPKRGGIYTWVKASFGKEVGFLAVWLQWVENILWYPQQLGVCFKIIALGVFGASLSLYWLAILTVMLFLFLTWINLRGMEMSAVFSNICTIFGLLLPMMLIIGLGIYSGVLTHPVSSNTLVTSNSNFLSHFSFLSVVMLSFTGMEIATVHSDDVYLPKKTFPKALIIAAFIIFITQLVGAMSIAHIVHPDMLKKDVGLIQTIQPFLTEHHLLFLTPVFALTLAFGLFGSMSNWIVAPTRGLSHAFFDLDIMKRLVRPNKNNMPTGLLLSQAALVCLLVLLFRFFNSFEEVLMFLIEAMAMVYMMMYVLMFASLLQRAICNHTIHIIPGKKFGAIIISIMGLLGSLFATINVLFNSVGDRFSFYVLLFIAVLAIPFLICWLKSREN